MKKSAKENSIYATVKKNEEGEIPEEEKERVVRLEFSNGAGQGKWHTGYLTFATKFK